MLEQTPTVIVGEAVAGYAAMVRRKLMQMVGNLQTTTFDVAQLLLEADEKHLPQQWGYDSLSDYGAQELGLKPRKIQYLVKIQRVCRTLNVTREQQELIGVSKLRMITKLEPGSSYFNPATKENEPMSEHILRLIKDGVAMSSKEVDEEVRRLLGQMGDDAIIIRSIAFVKAAYEKTIKPGMEKLRKNMGSAGRDAEGKAIEYSDGAVIEMAFANVLADPNFDDEPVELKKETEHDDSTGDTGDRRIGGIEYES